MLQIFPMCRMEICIKLGLKPNFFMFSSQFINVLHFLRPCSLLIQYMKMYMSEDYVYQRISLQHWKMREKLSFTLGTPIVGHPVPKTIMRLVCDNFISFLLWLSWLWVVSIWHSWNEQELLFCIVRNGSFLKSRKLYLATQCTWLKLMIYLTICGDKYTLRWLVQPTRICIIKKIFSQEHRKGTFTKKMFQRGVNITQVLFFTIWNSPLF